MGCLSALHRHPHVFKESPEPPSNETQAVSQRGWASSLTPSSHRQPHPPGTLTGHRRHSAVLQAHSPSSCDPRAGAFSYLTNHCGLWSLGHLGRGQGAAQAGRATAAASLHPCYSPPNAPLPSRRSRLGTQLAPAQGRPFSVIKKPLLSNKGISWRSSLSRAGLSGTHRAAFPLIVFRATPRALPLPLCSSSGSGTIPLSVHTLEPRDFPAPDAPTPAGAPEVLQAEPAGRGGARAGGPSSRRSPEGTPPGNTRAPILPIPRIICGRVANSPVIHD